VRPAEHREALVERAPRRKPGPTGAAFLGVSPGTGRKRVVTGVLGRRAAALF